MKFLNLAIDCFAGISNRTFNFTDGINVLLGDNETGKSTVIKAIEAALFLPSEIKGTNRAARMQKEYLKEIMPAGGGECSVSLEWENDRQTFIVKKQWGDNFSSSLYADGANYTGDNAVEKYIGALFPFSAATMQSLMFAKQGTFKQTIDNIRADGAKDISDLLRRAALNMGGVSVQTMKRSLRNEYERITGNWDIKTGLPQNGRGIDNPYQRGNGDIIENYYAREQARRDLRELKECEEASERIGLQICELIKEIENLTKEEARLSENSGTLILLREKEIFMEKLEKELARTKAINKNWIEQETLLKKLSKDIFAEKELIKNLQLRINAWEAFDRGLSARETLERIKLADKQLSDMQKELCSLPDITLTDVSDWKKRETELSLFESEKKGAKITAKVTADSPVYAEDADGRRAAAGDINAEGHVTLYIGDSVSVEITAGEYADSEKQISYRVNKQLCASYADKYEVSSAAEAEDILRKRDSLKNQIENIKSRRVDLLGNCQEQRLIAEAACSRPAGDRKADESSLEQAKINLARLELQSEQAEQTLAEYEEEFGVYNALLEKEQSIKESLAPVNTEVKRLSAACSSEYENSAAFITHLDEVRTVLSAKKALLEKLKSEQSSYTSDITSKEAEQAEKEYDTLMRQALKRAESIDKILNAVYETLASIHTHAYSGLTERFRTYLARLTQGRYTSSEFSDELSFTLSREDKSAPRFILSEGTTDALALAFRFSMLDNVMTEHGICVLDDCLVDLDAQRADSAAKLIREYSEKNQVIFATCNPSTAALLGGNIIHMRERI
jgi:exonuclease SbcC